MQAVVLESVFPLIFGAERRENSSDIIKLHCNIKQ